MKEKFYKIEVTYATYMGVAIDGTEDNPHTVIICEEKLIPIILSYYTHTGIKQITIKEVIEVK